MEPNISFSGNYHYKWVAHFVDESVLCQFDEDGTQHTFAELEAKADLIDYLEISGLPMPVIINLPKSSKPVIFERHRVDTDGVNEIEHVWHYFGWTLKTDVVETSSFMVIHEQGGQLVLISSEFTDMTTR